MIAEGTAQARGQTWRLCIDSDFIGTLQRMTGKKPKAILRALYSMDGDLQLMRTVTHAMLRRHHPTAGIEVAGDLLSEDFAAVGAVIVSGSRQPSGLSGRQTGPRQMLH